jgi:hypothetical protein
LRLRRGVGSTTSGGTGSELVDNLPLRKRENRYKRATPDNH